MFWGGGQHQSKLCAVFPRREPALTLTLLPPFTFFEKRGFQKKNSGWNFQNPPRKTQSHQNSAIFENFFIAWFPKKRTVVGFFRTCQETSRGPHKILLYLWGIKTSNSRRFKGFYLTLLPPFTFFEKRGFQKKNCGEILAVLESIIIPCEALCHCERSVAISRKGHRILGKV